ncbi:MAG: hypothetical protein QM496_04665 [Verrucomicrobiota bacterium]
MPEHPFIELTRCFSKLDPQDIESDIENAGEILYSYGRSNAPTWIDLEQRYRTIILAEGGAGKTREMQEMQKALTKEGKHAYFLPLEALAEDSVEDLLRLENLYQDFQHWRDDLQEPAWLFLDAVDELKLKDGKFKKALQELRLALGNSEARAHIFVSCRPSDWKEIDIHNFQITLPSPQLSVNSARNGGKEKLTPIFQSAEDYFLAPLMKNSDQGFQADEDSVAADMNTATAEELEIYRLDDLDNEQIRVFVREFAEDQASSLLAELKSKDRWSFARRPQNLIEVISLWRDQGTLGTYTEQHEAFLRVSLRERENRPGESNQISPDQARLTAGRIAFALAMSKKRTICSPSPNSNSVTNLDSLELLQECDNPYIESLMRLRIFDPATYNRIKFHRRDVEEYLAANHIRHLFDKGIGSKKALIDLLFTETSNGQRILIPSRKQLAVWLAQWNETVRNQLIAVDPVLLISDADSEQLVIEDKIRVLKAIAKLPEARLRGSLPYDPATLRRFGSSELAETINALWATAQTSGELSEFFLSLVKEAEIPECEGLLYEAAVSESLRPLLRVTAIRALLVTNAHTKICEIRDSIMDTPEDWPRKTVRTVVADLFPRYLDVEQLASLVSKLGESKGDYSFNFGHSLNTIVEKLDPTSSHAHALRDELAKLILCNQSPGSAYYHPQSDTGWLSVILAELCHRQATHIHAEKKVPFLHSCIVASHFRDHNYQEQTVVKTLKELMHISSFTHEEVYLAEFDFVVENFGEKNGSLRVRPQYSLIDTLTDMDKEWLEVITRDTPNINLASMSFRELLALWNHRGRLEVEVDQLRALTDGKEHLGNKLNAWLKPQEPHPDEEEWEKCKEKQKLQEQQRIEGWKSWRDALIRDPETEFTKANAERNISNLFHWLWESEKSSGSYQAWNAKALKAAFGPKVYEHARELFSAYWRSADVKKYSERTDDHNKTPYSWIFALNGVLAEAEIPDWPNRLTREDVKQATRLAQVEINGLATYLDKLASHHPEAVAEELSDELAAQLKMASKQKHLPLLQDLTHASTQIKKLVIPTLLDYVSNWRDIQEIENSEEAATQHHVSEILRILLDLPAEFDAHSLEASTAANFTSSPASATSVEWLRYLMTLNAERATSAIEVALQGFDIPLRKDSVVRWFGTLFDQFHGSSPIPTDPHILARLAKIAYSNILESEDQKHPSGVVYSPNPRDGAQGARSALLNTLISLQHPDVPSILEGMAEDPVFESAKQFIQNRAHVITINSLEPAPWSTQEIQSFESKLERFPVDRESLDILIQNRLDDLQHDITHHDFFPRKTVREIIQEDEMQRMLALLLEKDSNGLYGIAREDEAADGKKTDIRITTPGHDLKAVIEIKLADKRYTVADLETAIENQLQQQYLRHEHCKVGVFLITNHGGHKHRKRDNSNRDLERKYWQHPTTRQRINWEDLLSHLQEKADELLTVDGSETYLSVVGLDLRAPELRPAH